ncbi:MAG TPA: response regulator [Parvibaculum sp.]
MNLTPTTEEAGLFAAMKVLIVDDSAEMRRLLAALLEAIGIVNVLCAPNGDAGLKLFAEFAPDLVITDGDMQPMDGYEMTRRIRAAHAGDMPGRNRDVPVLMVSGHRDASTVTRARDEGVTDYIVKPLTPALLYERLRAAIAQPIHIVETATYRGPSPTRKLTAHAIDGVKPL